MSTPVRAVLLALAVALGGTACSSGGDEGAAATTLPPRLPDRLELSVVERLVVERVPPGFLLMPDDVRDTGPSDLAKAIRDQGGSPEDRDFLVDAGFSLGYQRFWLHEDDSELLVFLYEFASAEGAAAQLRQIETAIRNAAQRSRITAFRTTGIPDGVGLEASDSTEPAVAVLFTRGGFWSMVRLQGRDLETVRSQALSVAREQYSLLP